MHSKSRVCRVCKHTKKAKQTVLLSWAEREYDRRSTEVGIKQELDAVVELFQTQEIEDSSLDLFAVRLRYAAQVEAGAPEG